MYIFNLNNITFSALILNIVYIYKHNKRETRSTVWYVLSVPCHRVRCCNECIKFDDK